MLCGSGWTRLGRSGGKSRGLQCRSVEEFAAFRIIWDARAFLADAADSRTKQTNRVNGICPRYLSQSIVPFLATRLAEQCCPQPSTCLIIQLTGTSMAKEERLRTAKAALIRALEITEKLLDGFPIPGAKGTIGAVLQIINEAEVCTKAELRFNDPYHHYRERPPTLNSVMN